MTTVPLMRRHAHGRQRSHLTVPESQWALWVALICTLGAVLLFGAVRPLVNSGVETALFAGTLLVLLRCWRRPDRLPVPWVLAPMLGFAVLVLIQWLLHWSVYPAVTLDGLVQLIAYGCVFYLGLLAFADAHNVRASVHILSVFAALVSAEAIVQKFTTGGMIYGFRDATMDARPIGPFTYHNFFAAFIELLLPLALVVAFSGVRHQDWSVFLRRVMAPTLMLASFFVAESRGGAVVLMVELLLGGVVLWRARRQFNRLRGRLVLVAIVVLGFTLLVGWGPFMRRWGNAGRDVSAGDRIQYSLSCLAIWRAYPWVGSGLNTFPQVYPKYRRFDNGKILLQAHDDIAQLLAETGGIGFGMALLFVAVAAWGIVRGLRRPLDKDISRYKVAIVLGCVGFVMHCGIDFVSHSPALTYLFWLLLALVLASTNPHRGVRTLPAEGRALPREQPT